MKVAEECGGGGGVSGLHSWYHDPFPHFATSKQFKPFDTSPPLTREQPWPEICRSPLVFTSSSLQLRPCVGTPFFMKSYYVFRGCGLENYFVFLELGASRTCWSYSRTDEEPQSSAFHAPKAPVNLSTLQRESKSKNFALVTEANQGPAQSREKDRSFCLHLPKCLKAFALVMVNQW